MAVAMAVDHTRVVLLAGTTGLVGREILSALLVDESVEAIHCVGRRPHAVMHSKLANHVVNFGALPKVDECFIALATTINFSLAIFLKSGVAYVTARQITDALWRRCLKASFRA